MSARLGIEITPRTVRAVRLGGWPRARAAAVEIAWDGESLAEAVAAVRERFGSRHRLGVAVALPFLFTKQVALPPLAAAEKRRILALEPERFFPVRGEDVVVAPRDADGLVFAVREAQLDAWLDALGALGAVDMVEPGPIALARALGAAHVRDATVLLNGEGEGSELLEIRGGRVERVRRIFGDLADALAAAPPRGGTGAPVYAQPTDAMKQAAGLQPLPPVGAVQPSCLAALGAALGVGARLDETLVSAPLAGRILGRRRRERTLAAAAALVALFFAVTSFSAWRERSAAKLDARLAEARARAAPALALQARAQALGREARALGRLETERGDPLEVLLAITRTLPPGTYLRSLRGSGSEWQLDGYARDAARLVPLFESDPRFEDVRFLSATARARVGPETYETFALALRVVPAP